MVTVPVMDREPFSREAGRKTVSVTVPAGTYAKAELYVKAEAVADFGNRLFIIAAGNVEIARFVTPHSTFTITVDETRFLKLFKGSVQWIVALENPASPGWLVTLTLNLTEGTPPVTPNYVPILLMHDFSYGNTEVTVPIKISNASGFIATANAFMGAQQMLHSIYADEIHVAGFMSTNYVIPGPEDVIVIEAPFNCVDNIRVSLPTASYLWDSGRITTSLAAIVSELPPVEHILTISSTTGGTTDPSPSTYSYPEGASALVTALPASGYKFDHWELDGIVKTENPISVLMDKDHSLHAVFTLITVTHTLQVKSSPISGVPVTLNGASAGSTPTPTIILQEGTHTLAVPEEVIA